MDGSAETWVHDGLCEKFWIKAHYNEGEPTEIVDSVRLDSQTLT
jgi:hypothetical protein